MSAPGSVEYLVILTVFMPTTGEYATMARTPMVDPNGTRGGILTWAREQLPERLRTACVMFFSAEPNAVSAPGATGAAAHAEAVCPEHGEMWACGCDGCETALRTRGGVR